MIDYSITKEINLFKVEENYFTANYNGKIYSIGELLFICLKSIQKNQSIEEITTQLNAEYELDVDTDFVQKNVTDFLKKIGKTEKNQSTLYNYIYLKVKIFGSKTINKITPLLGPLFNKYLLILLIPLGLFFTVKLTGLLYEDGILLAQSSFKETFIGLLIMYGGITILGLIHEFGHAAAAAYYKQPSSSIGFGFYIVFPVFYSDVSKIWNLNKWKRIVVNLGGIYFQLILNIAFFFIYLQLENMEVKIIFRFFVFANFILLIYAMNPFLRNDGYWVYSDFFGLPNLTQQAVQYPKRFMRLLKEDTSGLEKLKMLYKQLPLLIYTLLYYLIMTALVIGLLWLTYKNSITLKNIIAQWYMSDWSSIGIYKKLFGLLFGLFINIYFAILIIKRFVFKKGGGF